MPNQLYIGIEGEYFERYDIQVMFESQNLSVGASGKFITGEKSSVNIGLSYALHFYDITTDGEKALQYSLEMHDSLWDDTSKLAFKK